MDIYEICHDCKYAIFYSEDPGFSPKECGLASRCITYLDGCKKDLDPNSDGLCEGYEMRKLYEGL
jgi:hypothetical protein